jgi:hypothetical protein
MTERFDMDGERGQRQAGAQPDPLDANLRKLKELDESLSARDKRIVSALRRIAKRLDLLPRELRL